jgi:hypothetical protein
MSFLVRLAVLSAALSSSAFGLQDTESRSPLPLPRTDSVPPGVGQSRDRLFVGAVHNIPGQVNEPPGAPPVTTTVNGSPIPELPVAEAQIILIGNVDSLTPRLMPGSQGRIHGVSDNY